MSKINEGEIIFIGTIKTQRVKQQIIIVPKEITLENGILVTIRRVLKDRGEQLTSTVDKIAESLDILETDHDAEHEAKLKQEAYNNLQEAPLENK